MIELARILRTVVATLEQSHVSYVVVGSTAAAAWGVARTTRDIDIVVVLGTNQLDDVLEALLTAGLYVPVDQARAATSGGSFNVLDPEHGGKIDLFTSTISSPSRRPTSPTERHARHQAGIEPLGDDAVETFFVGNAEPFSPPEPPRPLVPLRVALRRADRRDREADHRSRLITT